MKLQVGFNRRFDHNHGRVQRLAAEGALGAVELVKITSRDPEPPLRNMRPRPAGCFWT